MAKLVDYENRLFFADQNLEQALERIEALANRTDEKAIIFACVQFAINAAIAMHREEMAAAREEGAAVKSADHDWHIELFDVNACLRYALNNLDSIERRTYVRHQIEQARSRVNDLIWHAEEQSQRENQ